MPLSPNFKRERRLRSGYKSTVWQYRDIRCSKVVAVKYLADKEDAKEEVKTLKRFWHPNVINFVDFFKWGDAFGIVMHGMDMDLRHFMETEIYDSVTVCEISLQSARGLHHVHGLKTLHADIKAENIGISINRKDGMRTIIHVRLLDFGSARLIADIKTGDMIRSTRSNQSPEKRLGMFHLPGDIYELGVVYQEVIDHSADRIVSNELCGGLVQDMLRPEFVLRPTSQQVLVCLGDPLLELWERLCSAASGHAEWKTDFDDLIRCEDPLTFFARDISSRMEFIVKLLSSDSLRQIEKAFFLLFKTAQGGDASVMQYLHHFHGVVDTTWWTKLFYCMAVDALSALPNFCLTDIIKLKLWAFSGVNVCERHVRGIFLNCLSEEHLLWCSRHQWGVGRVDFASFIGERI
jgi:serine/threonine protein kinase